MQLAEVLRAAAAVDVVDLALGIPSGPVAKHVVDAAAAALAAGWHQYVDPIGLPALRRAVATYLARTQDLHVDPDDEVTITCGATEGVFDALLAATDPGDEVVFFEPYYELYPGMIELAGAVPRIVPLRQPGWRVDRDELEAAVNPRTRAVLLNSPQNPTGKVFDPAELQLILEICRRHELTCISDEVYERYVYDGRRHVSPLRGPEGKRHCVVVGSLSKTLHISGWRIGFVVASRELTLAVRRVHERATVGTSGPLQHGAAVFSADDLPRTGAELQQARDEMVSGLRSCGFNVDSPEGGWFVLAEIGDLAGSASELARELVGAAGVLVAPGTAFFERREDGERWVRLTFARDHQSTSIGLSRMLAHLGSRRASTHHEAAAR